MKVINRISVFFLLLALTMVGKNSVAQTSDTLDLDTVFHQQYAYLDSVQSLTLDKVRDSYELEQLVNDLNFNTSLFVYKPEQYKQVRREKLWLLLEAYDMISSIQDTAFLFEKP